MCRFGASGSVSRSAEAVHMRQALIRVGGRGRERSRERPARTAQRTAAQSVYTEHMQNKKRVNITIDSAVHDEMRKFLGVMGQDFSAFVEHMCVGFIGQMRPLIKRLDGVPLEDSGLTPSEVRVMFLQMMGSIQVEAGSQMNVILKELDTIEAEQRAMPKLLTPEKKPIHTPKVTKGTKTKK